MVGLKTIREKLLIAFVEGLNVLVAGGKNQDQCKVDRMHVLELQGLSFVRLLL